MNRFIALISTALLLGAAPIAALAQSNTQQPAGSSTQQRAGGTYQAPSASSTQQMPSQNPSTNGPTSGSNRSASMPGTSGENPGGSMAATKSPEEVQKIQSALNQKGERVKVDGIWGPQTAEAVRDFQKKNGLRPSGQLDNETLQKLDVASSD